MPDTGRAALATTSLARAIPKIIVNYVLPKPGEIEDSLYMPLFLTMELVGREPTT
jgi:hypothetical protein